MIILLGHQNHLVSVIITNAIFIASDIFYGFFVTDLNQTVYKASIQTMENAMEEERLQLVNRKKEIQSRLEQLNPSQVGDVSNATDKKDFHWDYVMKEMVRPLLLVCLFSSFILTFCTAELVGQ